MNHRLLAAALAMPLVLGLDAHAAPESYTIDPGHTFPSFEIGHFGYSLQRGRFNKTAGKVAIDTAAKKGSVEVTIDAASVSTGHPKLEEHLRGEDFLDVAKHPTLTYRSSKMNFAGDKVKSVEGELTMRGISRPVTLDATQFNCAPHPMNKKQTCGAEFVATIKRSEWGIKYALPVLADEMTLRINVEAIKD